MSCGRITSKRPPNCEAPQSVPLTVSERLLTRFAFRDVLEREAVDIVMLDLAWTGGFSESRKIAAMAAAHQLPVAPRNCGGVTSVPRPENGVLPTPDGPGLGAELRLELFERPDLVREVTDESGTRSIAHATGDRWATERF